jgi:peptidyl-prolyl cis-trans isomerase D
VVRVIEHRPARLQDFEAVKSALDEIVRLELAAEKARTRGEQVIQRLRGGESIDVIAAEYGFEVTTPGLLDRGSDSVDPQLLAAIFRAPKPDSGQPVFQGEPLANGGYAIFRLDSVQPGLPEAIPQEQRDARKQNLAGQLGRSASAALVTDLRADANVFVAPGLFDRPDPL